MPSGISHAIVGLAANKVVDLREYSRRFLILSLVCPVLPDIDIIGTQLGIPYGHPVFGHRYFFHSLLFAVIITLLVVPIFFRNEKIFSKRWSLLSLYFFVIIASHGLLDALASSAYGVAFFCPFDNTRYFLPVTPLMGIPSKAHLIFSNLGIRIILIEILWIWLPSILLVAVTRLIRIYRGKLKERKIINSQQLIIKNESLTVESESLTNS